VSHQTVVSLIASTTTQTGLVIKAALDTNRYEAKAKSPTNNWINSRWTPHPFHGDWNYMFTPHGNN